MYTPPGRTLGCLVSETLQNHSKRFHRGPGLTHRTGDEAAFDSSPGLLEPAFGGHKAIEERRQENSVL